MTVLRGWLIVCDVCLKNVALKILETLLPRFLLMILSSHFGIESGPFVRSLRFKILYAFLVAASSRQSRLSWLPVFHYADNSRWLPTTKFFVMSVLTMSVWVQVLPTELCVLRRVIVIMRSLKKFERLWEIWGSHGGLKAKVGNLTPCSLMDVNYFGDTLPVYFC